MRAHVMTNDNQILHGDQTRWEKNITGSTNPAARAPKIIVTRMLRDNLFTITKLFVIIPIHKSNGPLRATV